MSDRNYGALREASKAIPFIERITASGKPFAFDIEAGYVGEDKEYASLKQFHPEYLVVGISFTVSTDWARYIPFAHDDDGNVDDLPAVARALWRMLQTGNGIAHNAAYELKGMSRFFREHLWNDPEVGAEVRASNGFFPIHADTQLMVWLAAAYDPLRVGKDLKSVALNAFGLEMTKFEDLFPPEDSDLGPGTKRGKSRFNRFNSRSSRHPKVVNYACEDSVASLMIYEKHIEDLRDQFIFKIESGLIPVLCEMEMGPVDEHGVAQGNMYFDWLAIERKAEEVSKFATLMNEEILAELSDRLGRVVNINLGSVPQLSKVLYEEAPEGLGLPVKVRSEKTNNPSTSDDALKVVAKSDPTIKKILEWRQIKKLYGSYLDKFRTELNYAGTGHVFPNHNQFGALTGRMSVDQVSYQQWPKPYHFELSSGQSFDLNFRDLFIAPDGYRIVGFDYSQVELRVLAAMAQERAMLEAFANGTDIHKATAANMMGVPLAEVTKKMRSVGKTLNFAVVYGSGANNIAEMLTSPESPVSKEDAQGMLDRYFEAFSGLRNWMDARIAEGREQKYVNTFFGRKFTVWEYYDSRDWIRAKGDRMCVNAPVQGGAADYLKIAMVRARAAIKKAEDEGRIPKDGIRLTLTIHDALEFLVHESVATQTVIDLINPCVSFPVKGLPVQIKADWHEGYQWGAVAEISLDSENKISGYDLEYELPWAKEAFDWNGTTLHEVLDSYYAWEWERFGAAAEFYAKRNPTFTLPARAADGLPEPEHLETPAALPEGTQAAMAEAAEREGKSLAASINHQLFPDDYPAPDEKPDDTPMALAADPEPEPQRTVTVTVSDMPTETQWPAFKAYLAERPGTSTVVFETPEGNLTLDTTHRLTQDDQPQISLILGGADLSITNEPVGMDLLEQM